MERAFGVLMARFAILKTPARLWDKDDLSVMMRACIILHNMIIESQRDDLVDSDFDNVKLNMGYNNSGINFQAFLNQYHKVHDIGQHRQLQDDLIEHLWRVKGDEE